MNIYYIFGVGLFAFAAGLSLTALLIPFLKKVKAGQNIREEGPESHQIKAGTPSMGGLAIIGAILLAGIAGGAWSPDTFAAMLGFLLFAVIGFVDDYLKIVKKQNLGLRAWQKFSMQLLISLGFAMYMGVFSQSGTEV